MDTLSNQDGVVVWVKKLPDGFIILSAGAPNRLTGMAIELTREKAEKLLRDLQAVLS